MGAEPWMLAGDTHFDVSHPRLCRPLRRLPPNWGGARILAEVDPPFPQSVAEWYGFAPELLRYVALKRIDRPGLQVRGEGPDIEIEAPYWPIDIEIDQIARSPEDLGPDGLISSGVMLLYANLEVFVERMVQESEPIELLTPRTPHDEWWQGESQESREWFAHQLQRGLELRGRHRPWEGA